MNPDCRSLMPGLGAQRAFRFALLLCLGSCEGPSCETQGFESLFDSSESTVELPGTRLTSRRLERLGYFGTDADGSFVVGIDAEGALVIVPLAGGDACTAGPAETALWPGVRRSTLPSTVVPYVESRSEGFGTLHLVDPNCQPLVEPVPEARIVPGPYQNPLEPRRILAATRAGELFAIDPWGGEVSRLAQGVSRIEAGESHLWTVESGQLVARELDLDESGRFGQEVVALVVYSELSGSSELEGDEAYFEDFEGVHRIVVEDGALVESLVQERGCGMVAEYQWRTISFVMPADPDGPCQGTLVFHDGREAGFGSVMLTGSEPSPAYVRARAAYFLTSVQQTDWGPVGALHVGRLDGEQPAVADEVSFDSLAFGDRCDCADCPCEQELRFLAEFDGERGRLIGVTSSGATREIASDVMAVGGGSDLAIVGPESSPVLVQLEPDGGLRPRLEGVHPERSPDSPFFFSSTSYQVETFLTDFDGSQGTLHALDTWTDALQRIDTEVAPGYEVTELGFSLIYLRDVDPETRTGTMVIRMIESGDSFAQGGVAEWVAVRWPEPGIVHSGSRGVWFARAL